MASDGASKIDLLAGWVPGAPLSRPQVAAHQHAERAGGGAVGRQQARDGAAAAAGGERLPVMSSYLTSILFHCMLMGNGADASLDA